MSRSRAVLAFAGVVALAAASSACSSVRSSAVPTGAVRMPAHRGEVTVFSALPPPAGAIELGIVEVHGAQSEAGIDTLIPLFIQRVADLGGDIAVVDSVRAVFDSVARGQLETFYYTCAGGLPCSGSRYNAYTDEVLYVVVRGRALRAAGSAPPAPAPATTEEVTP